MSKPASDSGFVQILVLASLAGLSSLLLLAMTQLRSASAEAASLERLVNVDVATASAFHRVIAAFSNAADDLRSRAAVASVDIPFGRDLVRATIVSEDAKLDVVRIDMTVLDRYALDAGLSLADRQQLLSDVEAARAAGDTMEAMDALRMALASVGTVDTAPDLTTHGSATVDSASASYRVLAALPDLAASDAARIAATPAAERGQFAQLSRYFGGASRRFTIEARVSVASGQTAVRRLPFEISTAGRPIVLGGPY